MRNNPKSFVRRALRDERGQVLPWVIFGMIGMLSMAGVSVDVGHAYAVRNQLQSAVQRLWRERQRCITLPALTMQLL
jgi:Flp pilus assembly protein TadG